MLTALLALAAAAACTQTVEADSAPASCGTNNTNCDGACIDTSFNSGHCGGCGNACPVPELCMWGECIMACTGGTVRCGERCVDFGSNPDHCGACDNACPAGTVCSQFECSVACGAGAVNCEGACVNTTYHPKNCGGCGKACGSDEVCSAGACMESCAEGETLCGGLCVDTANDSAHCGGCGKACAASDTCLAGACLPPGGHLWSKSFDIGWDAIHANVLAIDAADNVLLSGAFDGTVSFGGAPLVTSVNRDIFLAKFDVSGKHQWSKRFVESGDGSVASVAVDPLGDVLVAGKVVGAVDFGGGALKSVSQYGDYFLAKLDASGKHLWSKAIGTNPSGAYFGLPVVTTDASANVLVAKNAPPVVSKLDASGSPLWSKPFVEGNAGGATNQAIVADAAGNVIVTGRFWGETDFGNSMPLAAVGTDLFVVKLDPSGKLVWIKSFSGGQYTSMHGYGVAVDTKGNVLVTGVFWGAVDFGSGPLTSVGHQDIFVLKLDPTGNHLWSKSFGSNNGDDGVAIAADAADNVVVTGSFMGTVDFGGGPYDSAGSCTGDPCTPGPDIFVLKLDALGKHLWSKGFGGNSSWRGGNDVGVDSGGNVVFSGHLFGSIDVGGGPLQSVGEWSGFLAKLSP